jgi:hypothetical protein
MTPSSSRSRLTATSAYHPGVVPGAKPKHRGTETVLTGLLRDSSALYGVLVELEALGLDLLEVRKVLL